ncbi:MAG: NlpC/P60 family protein, partial [Oscillibacter sp.]
MSAKRSKATSGQHGPKFRQESEQTRPSERLRQEDEAPHGDSAGASDPKAAKETRRFEKAGQRAEKAGAKLTAAQERLANQKPPKRPGPVKVVTYAAAGAA